MLSAATMAAVQWSMALSPLLPLPLFNQTLCLLEQGFSFG